MQYTPSDGEPSRRLSLYGADKCLRKSQCAATRNKLLWGEECGVVKSSLLACLVDPLDVQKRPGRGVLRRRAGAAPPLPLPRKQIHRHKAGVVNAMYAENHPIPDTAC